MGDRQLRSSLSASLVFHLVLLMLGGGLVWKRGANRDPQVPVPEHHWVEFTPEPTLQKKSPIREVDRIVQTKELSQAKKPQLDPDRVFRGERDQRVERETVSKNQFTQSGSTGSRTSPPKRVTPRTLRESKVPSLNQLGLTFKRVEARRPGDSVEDTPPDSRRWAAVPGLGEGVPQDYIHGLKESETTALNTREYVFFGYFQRIREKLDRAWASRLREQVDKVYRRGRQLANDYEYTTRTVVTLNPDGQVTRVRLMEGSGALDLDDAAIQAFNEAGPFPNPPSGLLSTNREVEIRWDFVVRN